MEKLQKDIKVNHPAVVEIFEKNYSSLLLFGVNFGASRAETEDCIQDLFLKFCENEHLILGADHPKAYLQVSLRRQLLKQKRKQESPNNNLKILEISVPSYEDQIIKQQNAVQDAIAVQNALSSLSKSQKTIMTMRFYRGMSYEDIAGKLGITKRTVYNQVHDAMKKMKSNFRK